jgi:hypothetical protein
MRNVLMEIKEGFRAGRRANACVMAGVGGQREGSEGKEKNNDGNGKDRSTTAA